MSTNNCLVTKLKAAVDNSNLERLGEIVLHFSGISPVGTIFPLRVLGSDNISIVDGSSLLSVNADMSSPVNSMDNPGEYIYIQPVEGTELRIKNFYNVTNFGVSGRSSNIGQYYTVSYNNPSSKLKLMKSLTTIKMMYLGKASENTFFTFPLPVDALPDSLTELSCARNLGLTGDFKNLGKCYRLRTIDITSSGITGGAIEDFVAICRAARTAAGVEPTESTGISLPFVQNLLTIGGNTITLLQTSENAKLYWTANTITYDNGRTGEQHGSITVNA